MNKKKVKENAFNNVSKYNIDRKILNKIFTKIYSENLDEATFNKKFDIEIEKYMVSQIKKGQTIYKEEIKKSNDFLKVMMQRNKEYCVDKEYIDKLYENALDTAIEEYSDKQALNIQILKFMKKLSWLYNFNVPKTKIKSKIEQTEEKNIKQKEIKNVQKQQVKIDNEILSKQIIENNDELVDQYNRINASFLNLLIINGKMKKIDLMMHLKMNYDKLESILNGTYTIEENKLSSLYKKYNVTNVYELKKKIIIECGYSKEDNNIKEKNSNDNENIINIENMISLLKRYIKQTNKSEKQFSLLIGETEETIIKCFTTGNTSIQLFNKILKYFSAETLKDLELKILLKTKEEIKQIEEDLRKKEMDNIDKLELYELLDQLFINKKLTDVEYVISSSLFGRDGRYYTTKELAEHFKIEQKEVEKIYKKCVVEYKNIRKEQKSLTFQNEDN